MHLCVSPGGKRESVRAKRTEGKELVPRRAAALSGARRARMAALNGENAGGVSTEADVYVSKTSNDIIDVKGKRMVRPLARAHASSPFRRTHMPTRVLTWRFVAPAPYIAFPRQKGTERLTHALMMKT